MSLVHDDDPALDGNLDRVGARAGAELAHGAAEIGVHRPLAQI